MDEKLDKFFISCDCGCGNTLEIKGWKNDFMYISFLESSFYKYQIIPFANLRDRIRLATNKNNCLMEICCTKEDLQKLKNYLINNKLSDEQISNCSRIIFEYDADIDMYFIILENIQNKLTTLFGKIYQAFEFEINEKVKQQIIQCLNELNI